MEVGDKNMLDTGEFNPQFSQLNLCSFAAVDQDHLPVDFEQLSGGLCIFSRCGGIAAQDG